MSDSLLTVMGPLARTVKDAAVYMGGTMGCHPADPHALPAPGCSYLSVLEQLPRRFRIAYRPGLGYAVVQKGDPQLRGKRCTGVRIHGP